MFSDQLIDQLSLFIIRPHRQIYGLDKLGPKKLIVKSESLGCYVQAYRQESTIISQGKKIQLSVFVPYYKQGSNGLNNFAFQGSQNLTRSSSFRITQMPGYQNSNQATIFLHTNSGSRLEGLEYCKYLIQHGHIVCVFDYSGSGVSQGQYVSMGLNQSKDLANVVKFLQQKFEINKVNLWGRSMGAVTAIFYCSKYPQNVKKMVLDSPFCSFRQLVKQIVNLRTGLPDFLFGMVLSRIQQNLQKTLNLNLMDINLKNQIIKPGMQNIPIFFLISKDDKLVQPIHVQTLYQSHKGPRKIIYLQGSHNKPRPSEIRQQCAQFLCNKMNNIHSQKVIQSQKKQYLSLLSRKNSQDNSNQRKINPMEHHHKIKMISSSLIFNASQYIENPPLNTDLFLQNSAVNSGNNQYYKKYQSPLHLNLSKKNKMQTNQQLAQSSQSSTIMTPRDDQSVGKYPPNSKISLSQFKKSQVQGIQISTTNPIQLHGYQHQHQHPPQQMHQIQQQIQVQIQQNQMSTRNINAPAVNPFRNSHVDFKKHSKTMAIQYKNKIKQHINKT